MPSIVSRLIRKLRSASAVLAAAFLALPGAALAASPDLGLEFATATGLGTTDIRTTVARIISYFLGLLGLIALVLILYAGFTWMTAGGNEEKVSSAKTTLRNAVIGLIIIMSAFAITQFILRSIEEGTLGNTASSDDGGNSNTELLGSGSFQVTGVTPSGSGPNNAGWPKNYSLTVNFNADVSTAGTPANYVKVWKCNPRLDGSGVAQAYKPTACDATTVPGTVTVDGNRIVFRPSSTSGANPTDFEPDFWYKIQAVSTTVKDSSGRQLKCPTQTLDISSSTGTSSYCSRAAAFNAVRDTEPPKVSIDAPASPPSYCAGVTRFAQVSASGTDDYLVAGIDYLLDGATKNLTDAQGLAKWSDVNDAGNAPFNSTAVNVDIGLLASGSHTISATARDGVPQTSSPAQRTFDVKPLHCCNNVKDGAETGVDCGDNECGLCVPQACTSNAQCSSGVCVNGVCAIAPTITGISPASGGPGTLVTITGTNFGTTKGTVTFLGATGTADDTIANTCNDRAWTNTSVVVEVPANAKSGPIMLAGSTGSDATDDALGPKITFTVNTNVTPGICYIEPSEGLGGTDFAINGIGFGATAAADAVQFAADTLVPTACQTGSVNANCGWSNTKIWVKAPNYQAGNYPVTVKASGKTSNPSNFVMKAPDGNTLPRVTSVIPEDGPVGTYVTVMGSHFGTKGVVKFAFKNANGSIDYAIADDPICADNWHDNSIVVKVPAKYVGGFDVNATDSVHGIVVEAGAGTNQDPFGVSFSINKDPLQPGICSISPDNGPASTLVTVQGEGFNGGATTTVKYGSASSPRYSLNFFNKVGNVCMFSGAACTTLGTFCAGAGGACVPNTLPATQYSGWNDTTVSAYVVGDATDKNTWPKTGPVYVIAKNQLSANAVPFTVQDCNDAGVKCGAGTQCCDTGSCAASCDVAAKTSAYGWRFSTTVLPTLPVVIERAQCTVSPAQPQSPSPAHNSQDACKNALMFFEFNRPLDTASFTATTVKVEKCAGTTAPDCAAPVAVPLKSFSNPGAVPTFSGCISGTANCTMFQAQPAATYNGGVFEKKTWYRVTLVSNPTTGSGIREALPNGKYLDGDVDRQQGGDYVTYFRTSDSDDPCEIANVEVSAPSQLISDDVSVTGFTANPTAGNCNKLQCDDSAYAITWNAVTSPLQFLAFPSTGQPASYCSRNVRAVRETPAGVPTSLTAVMAARSGGPSKSGASAVTVKFADPRVVSVMPTEGCTAACINAAVGAVFNIDMKSTDFSATNVELKRCRNQSCSAPFDPLGFTPTFSLSADKRTLLVQRPAGTDLAPGTFYLVRLKGDNPATTAIEGVRSNSGVALAGLNDGLYYSWKFRTKDDPAACGIARTTLEPSEALLRFAGDRVALTAVGYSAKDACSDAGQVLDTSAKPWSWSFSGQNKVLAGFVRGEDFASAVFRYWRPEFKTTPTTVVDAVPQPKLGCTTSCLFTGSQDNMPSCGNGKVEAPYESCDDGNNVDTSATDVCHNNCTLRGNPNAGTTAGKCGNGIVEASSGEECDKIAGVWPAGCKQPNVAVAGFPTNVGCLLTGSTSVAGSVCGDGFIGDGESCDDGNRADGDGCSSNCLSEGSAPSCKVFPNAPECLSVCGNGLVEPGEDPTCEPNPSQNNCNVHTCLKNGTPTCNVLGAGANCCGNGITEKGEDAGCDTVNGIAEFCSASCVLKGSSYAYDKPSFCGDGYKGAGEQPLCEATTFGDGNVDSYQAVVANPTSPNASGFDAVAAGGNMSKVQAVIGALPADKIGTSTISLNCTCNKEPAGTQDAFCSGMRSDLACADNGCCMSRPTVSTALPTTFNSCRNVEVTMVFSEPMRDTTLTGSTKQPDGTDLPNVMVGYGNGTTPCPAGTLEVPTAYEYGGSFWSRVWTSIVEFFRNNVIRPVFGVATTAGYDKQKFCSIPGIVSTHVDGGQGNAKVTVLSFTPTHALPANKVIRIRLNPGIKSMNGVPLSTTDVAGAGGYTAYFGTGVDLCTLKKVMVVPESILLSATDDTQPVTAMALSAADQPIVPTPEYSWTWEWTSPAATAPLVLTPRLQNETTCSLSSQCQGPSACPCYLASGTALCNVPKGSQSCTGATTTVTPTADLRVRGSQPGDNYTPKNSKSPIPINANAVVANRCTLTDECAAANGCTCTATAPFTGTCTVAKGESSCVPSTGSTIARVSSIVTTATGSATVMLCKHPWPRYQLCSGSSCTTDYWKPYSPLEFPGLSFSYCRDDVAAPTSLAPSTRTVANKDGIAPTSSRLLAGTAGETLPCLKETPASVASPIPGILREYLFTFETGTANCPDGPQVAGKWRSDAVGMRVSPNSEHMSIADWYADRGFRGAPQPTIVDGYDALTEDRTTYVSAASRLVAPPNTNKLFTNAYIISYSDNSSTETRAIYNQILSTIDFNSEPDMQDMGSCFDGPSVSDQQVRCTTDNDCRVDSVGKPIAGREAYKCDANKVRCLTSTGAVASSDSGNPVSCNADNDCQMDAVGNAVRSTRVTCVVPKAKVTRDVKRFSDLLQLRAQVFGARGQTGSVPTLAAGTFMSTRTNSAWPSWTEVLTTQLGQKTIPTDPLNTHAACKTTTAPYDPATCWDSAKRQYVCPNGSHVYEYQAIGSGDFSLKNDFEYTGAGVTWSGSTCLDYTDLASCTADPRCGGTCSNNANKSCFSNADCGGGSCTGACNFLSGKIFRGFSPYSSAVCQGAVLSAGTGTCGDGIVNNNEVCELGDVSQTSCDADPTAAVRTGFAPQVCNSTCSGFVNQGVCSASSVRPGATCTDDVGCAGGKCVNWTVFRCSGDGTTACTKDLDCSSTGKGVCVSSCSGGTCGDGVVQSPEKCDDGPLNGTYGHCQNGCTGAGLSCGDGVRQPNEVCDCGANNGQYSFNARTDASGISSSGGANVVCTALNPAKANDRTCSWDCSSAGPRCGDGIVNGSGEACDGGFQEFKGFCNDKAQTGCDTSSQCPSIGTCVAKKCTNGSNVACTTDADCVPSCGNFCAAAEQKRRRSCNSNDPSTASDDANACQWSTWTCTAPGTCGNGTKETGEQCDDGNTNNNDSCIIDTTVINQVCVGGTKDGQACTKDSTCSGGGTCQNIGYMCKAAVCGDGYLNPSGGEECDDGRNNGHACVPDYGVTCNYCNAQCRTVTVSGSYCGDNFVQDAQWSPPGPESCDGTTGLTNEWVCVSDKPEYQSYGLITGPGGCLNQSCQRGCLDPNSHACFLSGENTDKDSCKNAGPGKDYCDNLNAKSAASFAPGPNPPGLALPKTISAPEEFNDSCDPDDDNDGVPDAIDCGPRDPGVHGAYQIRASDGSIISIDAAREVCEPAGQEVDNDCDGNVNNIYPIVGKVVNARTGEPLAGAAFDVKCNGIVLDSSVSDDKGEYRLEVLVGPSCSDITIEPKNNSVACADPDDAVRITKGSLKQCIDNPIADTVVATPRPAKGEKTLFLTWDGSKKKGPYNPPDLDLHALSHTQHLGYVNDNDYGKIDGFGWDLDSWRSGKAIETMTVHSQQAGMTYSFYVKNYGDLVDWGTKDAEVRMFDSTCAENKVKLIDASYQKKNIWWVMTMKDNTVTKKNVLQDNPPANP